MSVQGLGLVGATQQNNPDNRFCSVLIKKKKKMYCKLCFLKEKVHHNTDLSKVHVQQFVAQPNGAPSTVEFLFSPSASSTPHHNLRWSIQAFTLARERV